jgi:type II secretory pathway pseudopilin PulG
MKKQFKKGFSLLELVIYMGLLSILIVVLTQIFTSIIQVRLDSQSSSSIEQDANFIISRFMYDIGRAETIVTPATLGVAGDTVQFTVGGVTNTYSLVEGNLQITNNNGTDNLNSLYTTISNLQFNRIGNGTTPLNSDTIKMTFTVTTVVKQTSGNASKSYEIAVAPR